MTATSETRRPRALLLESDLDLHRSVRAALELRGFEVLSARDGALGVDLLLEALLDLDVLVTALALPQRDGASLLHLLRHAGGEEELPVVVLAPGTDAAVQLQLKGLGADAVVGSSDADAVARTAARVVAGSRPSAARRAPAARRSTPLAMPAAA